MKKIVIDLTPEMERRLEKRTKKIIDEMKADGYDFSDWTMELEATTVLREALSEDD